MLRAFGPYGRGDISAIGESGKILAGLSAIYCILLIGCIGDEITFYRKDNWDFKGDRKGYWSLAVSGNWRLIFTWSNGRAGDVDLIDFQ